LTLAAVSMLAAVPALAQWQWVDSNGKKVFSDMPPPASVPEKNIVKRPRGRAPVPPPDAGADAAPAEVPASTGVAPAASGSDPQLEAKKKQAEQAEQARRKAEAEKQAKARAETCERAKRSRSTIDSGIRLATTNAKGEREILDDKARAAERERIEGLIRSSCGPLPASPAPAQ
jgi:hypothetical protein